MQDNIRALFPYATNDISVSAPTKIHDVYNKKKLRGFTCKQLKATANLILGWGP